MKNVCRQLPRNCFLFESNPSLATVLIEFENLSLCERAFTSFFVNQQNKHCNLVRPEFVLF